MLIAFGPRYEIGHVVIDGQHKQLFGILNRLHDAMKGREGTEALKVAFDELESYVRLHFKTEERLMRQHTYPGLEAHRAEHDEFVNKLFALYSDFERGHLTVAMKTLTFLREWLGSHIAVTDKRLGEFLQGRG